MKVGQSDKARRAGFALNVLRDLRGLKKAHELRGNFEWNTLGLD